MKVICATLASLIARLKDEDPANVALFEENPYHYQRKWVKANASLINSLCQRFFSLHYGRSIFYDSLSEDLTTAVNDSFTSERFELVFIEKTS